MSFGAPELLAVLAVVCVVLAAPRLATRWARRRGGPGDDDRSGV